MFSGIRRLTATLISIYNPKYPKEVCAYTSGAANSIIWGQIFIYSRSAQLISFKIDGFHGL